MKNKRLKICLYFPYHEVSGVPVLFYRIANELASRNDSNQIYVIDYIDGAMARNLSDLPNIQLLEFKNGVDITPPEDAILVMQSILPYAMRPELKIAPNNRILFWTLHPDCLVPVFFPLPVIRNFHNHFFGLYKAFAITIYSSLIHKLQKFTAMANEKKGLWFMDETNLAKTEKFLLTTITSQEFVPVPALEGNERKIVNVDTFNNGLHFCWLGRLCDFKSYILMYTIKKLSDIAKHTNRHFTFFVVGDGPFKDKIESLNVSNAYFKLKMFGSIKPKELDSFLLENVDVVAAMGTSALEGAKLAIPTILLDFSYYPIKGDYRFRWLHNTQNFDLGHDIEAEDYESGNQLLEKMIQALYNNYEKIAQDSFNYFDHNHSMAKVMDKFEKKVAETNLYYKDIDPKILKKSFLREIYNRVR